VVRSPGQLFAEYCASVPVEDTRVAALFGELHDEVTAAGNAD
jgi:exonuclease SbcD